MYIYLIFTHIKNMHCSQTKLQSNAKNFIEISNDFACKKKLKLSLFKAKV